MSAGKAKGLPLRKRLTLAGFAPFFGVKIGTYRATG